MSGITNNFGIQYMEFRTLKKLVKYSTQLLICFGVCFQALAANVSLVSGHVRALPPTVPNTAAYFTLKNNSIEIKLVKASTTAAKEAQLHTLLEENGVVKMRQVDGYIVPANSQLELSPSGNHIMIIGLTKPLKVGQLVPITLSFSDGSQNTIELPVQKANNQMEHHHHHY